MSDIKPIIPEKLNASRKLYILFAAVIYLVTAWFSEGWHHPDEHYQVLEFAQHLCGKISKNQLAWECTAQIRSSLQVWIAWAVMQPLYFFNLFNPFVVAFVLRALAAILSLVALTHFLLITSSWISLNTKRFYWILTLFSYSIVYTQVRFSSESLGASFMLLALSTLLHRQFAAFGFWAALSIVFRFQMGFFWLAAVPVWFIIYKPDFWSITKAFLGASTAFILMLVCDRLFYGNWVFTPYNYFYENIVNKVAASFGIEPFYWYLIKFIEQWWPPMSILVFTGIFLSFKNKKYSIITSGLLIFFIAHSAVGHKEVRFLFPVLVLLPLFVAITAMNYDKWLKPWFLKLILTFNAFLLIGVMFKPAHNLVGVYKFLYHKQTPVFYWRMDNPYKSGNNFASFYATEAPVHELTNNQNLPTGSYVVCEEKNFILTHQSTILEYSSIPTWLMRFNIGNWVERANGYYIFRVEPKENQP